VTNFGPIFPERFQKHCARKLDWIVWLPQSKTSRNFSGGLVKHGYSFTETALTKKAEPPPTRGVNRDSGTDSANGGWLRRLVRQTVHVSGL
jgi:hypothetical protein